ncbi:MAG: potassium transporter TrkG, partial [Candidatus Thermoplasmatota archaeon]
IIIGFVVLLVFLDLFFNGYIDGFLESVRVSAFQVVSILTTTGYTSVDYGSWSSFARFVILLLMFIGGCAGSTSGSVKQIRVLLMLKMLRKKLRQLLHPNVVDPVRIGGRVVSEKTLHTISMFFFAYILIFIISSGFMLFLGLDMITGISAAASCLGNIGPALGMLGPSYSYAAIPPIGKIWLVCCMWLGRLEIFTALILFIPTAYKRETFLK